MEYEYPFETYRKELGLYLANLKVGDVVDVDSSRYRNYSITSYKVERLTPTQVVTEHGKFRKSDGVMVGVGRDVFTWTPEIVAPSKAASLRKAAYSQKIKVLLREGCKMESDDIERMRKLLDAAQALLAEESAKKS